MTEPTLFDTPDPIPTPPAPKPTGMPDWLIRRLENAGLMDPDTGATRNARASRCITCRRPILIGIDSDWCGRSITCDPQPLARNGEALAQVLGIPTYMLGHPGGRWQLDYRDPWRIRSWPAATQRFDVLASHDCHRAVRLPTAPSVLADASTSSTAHLTIAPF